MAQILAEGLDGTARELTAAILELMSAMEGARPVHRLPGLLAPGYRAPADSDDEESHAKSRGRKQRVNCAAAR